jgi:hypothetical protein
MTDMAAAPVIPIFEIGDYDGEIAAATEVLRGGGVVVLPTETVYGAAAVLGHDKGISRLKTIRGGGVGGRKANRSPSTSPAASRRCVTSAKSARSASG